MLESQEHDQSHDHCDHSPMLKTASYTSYHLTHRSPSHFRPVALNLSRNVPIQPLHPPLAAAASNFHTSAVRMESARVQEYKKAGHRSRDTVPKHEMVVFKGLMSERRQFGDFRTVLHTGLFSQIVAMEVPVGGEIGDEVHTVDQILLFTSGKGLATVAGKDQEVAAGDVVVVPAGTQHQFVTRGDQPLELITVYSPAEHDPATVNKTKEEGDKLEEEGKDEPPAWASKSQKENVESGLVRESGKYD